jgi:hypothetical protein
MQQQHRQGGDAAEWGPADEGFGVQPAHAAGDHTPNSVTDENPSTSSGEWELGSPFDTGTKLTQAEQQIMTKMHRVRHNGRVLRARAVLFVLLFAVVEVLIYLCVFNPYLRGTDILKLLATFRYPHQTMLHIALLIITPADTSECLPSCARARGP